jgi:hypothetical protein
MLVSGKIIVLEDSTALVYDLLHKCPEWAKVETQPDPRYGDQHVRLVFSFTNLDVHGVEEKNLIPRILFSILERDVKPLIEDTCGVYLLTKGIRTVTFFGTWWFA